MKSKLIFGLFACMANLSIAQCEDFTATTEVQRPTCYGMSDANIYVFPAEGTGPYTIEIKDGSGSVLNVEGSNFADMLTAGWYYYTIEDAGGCFLSDSVNIEGRLPLEVLSSTTTIPTDIDSCNGSIVIDEVQSEDPIESLYFYWSPGDFGLGMNELTEACATSYILTIQDSRGCSVVESFEMEGDLSVGSEKSEEIAVYTSQNGLNVNISQSNVQGLSIRVMSLQGAVVQTTDLTSGLNAINVNLPSGIYLYEITDGNDSIKKGKVNF